MIYVDKDEVDDIQHRRYEIKDLTQDYWRENRSVFYGICGTGPLDVYIITYDRVCILDNPLRSYDSPGCDVIVHYWLEADIVVRPI